jgi:hypothetical protein
MVPAGLCQWQDAPVGVRLEIAQWLVVPHVKETCFRDTLVAGIGLDRCTRGVVFRPGLTLR